MAADKKTLENEMNFFKAQAYDILANMESVEIQYRNAKQDLQNKLNQVNQQIATKNNQIQQLEPQKPAAPPAPQQEAVKEDKQLLNE
jgi:hypothetical protein